MNMLRLLISFVWGFKKNLPIFDPGVKIKKFYQGYLANTQKCSEQNFQLSTASTLGAVMSNPTHIHTHTFFLFDDCRVSEFGLLQ